MGYMNVALIAAQTIGGLVTRSYAPQFETPSSGAGYTYSQPTAPSVQPEQKAETPRPMTVNVYVYGSLMGSTPDEISRSLIPYIRKAESDRV